MSARRVLATVATLAAAVFVLAGCVTSGTVSGKSYDDSYVSCVGTRCSDYDECWLLELRDDRGNEGNICVPQEEWDSTDVGDFYDGPTVQREVRYVR